MIGTAAATLLGLLFVSLSLNIDVIARRTNADLRVLATQTFTSFVSVLMFAVVFLIPKQVPAGLGLPLLGVGGGFSYTAPSFISKKRGVGGRDHGAGGSLSRHFAVPLICSAAILGIAGTVLHDRTDYLYWLVPVMILLLVAASRNAWDLLLRLRQPFEKR